MCVHHALCIGETSKVLQMMLSNAVGMGWGGAGIGVCITTPQLIGGARKDEVAGSSQPLPWPSTGSRHVGSVVQAWLLFQRSC